MKTTVQKVKIEADAHTMTNLEYETTGPMGGDTDHGGKTNLVLNLGHGAHVMINDKKIKDHSNLDPLKINIQVTGDWEMLGLEQALQKLGEMLPNPSELEKD